MKKISFIAAFVILLLTFSACSADRTQMEFPQKTLPEPDAIVIENASAQVIYEKASVEYQKLQETFTANWWLTVPEEPETANAESLIPANGPKDLKTTNKNRTYVTSSDTFICFVYEKAPLTWVQDNGKTISIQQVTFLLPEKTDTQELIWGSFTIAQTPSIGPNEGWFTYYYPAAIANNFWDWLLH